MAHYTQKSERIAVLSGLEEFAFYGFPDFDDEQRLSYFVFEDKELALISQCSSLHTQVTCAIQIGYFKAKQTFFSFSLNKIPKDDLNFILSRYFPNQTLNTEIITKYEYYLQREAICKLFSYTLWSNNFLTMLQN